MNVRILITLLITTSALAACDSPPRLKASSRDEAVHTGVSVLAVTPWEDIEAKLQGSFTVTPKDALDAVLPTTAYVNEAVLRSFGVTAGIGLPSVSVAKEYTTKQAGDTTTYESTETRKKDPGKAPALPSTGVTGAAKDGLPAEKSPGTDPFLRYRAAAQFMHEVAVLNEAVKNAAIRNDERAYVVRLQVGVIPMGRDFDYDILTNMAFLPQLCQPESAQTPSPFGLKPKPAAQGQSSTQETPDECLKRIGAAAPRLRVIPLLASDDVVASLNSHAEDVIRQFGFGISGMLQGIGMQAEAKTLNENLQNSQARSFNSAQTLAPLTENSVQARFGADFAGNKWVMQQRNQFITLLITVPKDFEGTIQVVARNDLRGNDGVNVPARKREDVLNDVLKVMQRINSDNALSVPETIPDELEKDCKISLTGVSDKTRAVLRKMYGMVLVNNQACFERTANWTNWGYWQTQWLELAAFAAISEYSPASFNLKKKLRASLRPQGCLTLLKSPCMQGCDRG